MVNPPSRVSESKCIQEFQIFLDDIKDGITGFARIIYYTNSSFSAIIEDNEFNKANNLFVNMNPLNLCL